MDDDADRPSTSTAGSAAPSRKSIPPFEALRAFDAVARTRSIRQAARSLERDHSIVSRHIRAIEEWVGVQLVERTATGVVLTEQGQRYHRHIGQALDAIARATTDLMRSGERRLLRLCCSPGFALHWMSGRTAAFQKACPDIELELRPIDRTPASSFNDADVDVRFVPAYYEAAFQPPPGARWEQLTEAPVLAVASPAYLADAEPITRPADLLRHRLLHEHNFEIWANWLAAHGVYDQADLHGPRLWHAHLTLDAALRGRGVSLMNQLVAADELAAGRLVEIGRGLESFLPQAVGSYLFVAREDRWNAPNIRSFRRWLERAIKT